MGCTIHKGCVLLYPDEIVAGIVTHLPELLPLRRYHELTGDEKSPNSTAADRALCLSLRASLHENAAFLHSIERYVHNGEEIDVMLR